MHSLKFKWDKQNGTNWDNGFISYKTRGLLYDFLRHYLTILPQEENCTRMMFHWMNWKKKKNQMDTSTYIPLRQQSISNIQQWIWGEKNNNKTTTVQHSKSSALEKEKYVIWKNIFSLWKKQTFSKQWRRRNAEQNLNLEQGGVHFGMFTIRNHHSKQLLSQTSWNRRDDANFLDFLFAVKYSINILQL